VEDRIRVWLPATRRAQGVRESTALLFSSLSGDALELTHHDEAATARRWELPMEVFESGLLRRTAFGVEGGRSGSYRFSMHPFLAAGRPFVALILPVTGDIVPPIDLTTGEDATLRFDVAWQPLLRTQRFLRLAARDGFSSPV
jgi:hypothetical protein